MTEAASRLNREPDGTSGSVPPSFRDLAITVYREAEANGDPEWAHAMPEERAAAVAGRILTVAREAQALEARGYTGPVLAHATRPTGKPSTTFSP